MCKIHGFYSSRFQFMSQHGCQTLLISSTAIRVSKNLAYLHFNVRPGRWMKRKIVTENGYAHVETEDSPKINPIALQIAFLIQLEGERDLDFLEKIFVCNSAST